MFERLLDKLFGGKRVEKKKEQYLQNEEQEKERQREIMYRMANDYSRVSNEDILAEIGEAMLYGSKFPHSNQYARATALMLYLRYIRGYEGPSK